MARDYNHDFVGILIEEVLALNDPRTIPVLVRSIDTAGSIAGTLTDYGRLAIPALLARVDGQQPAMEKTVDVVLITLRMMVQRQGLTYLASQERAALRSIAIRFLDLKPGDFPTDTEIRRWQESDEFWRTIRLSRAMQLAWVLNEPALREKVTAIATDPEALSNRGLATEQVQFVQERYERIKSGQPMLPTYSSMMGLSGQ